MDLTLRPVTADEFPSYFDTMCAAFGDDPRRDALEQLRAITELDRTLAAYEGDRIVATAGAHSFTLTVPGPEQLPAAGVTQVGVLPTHRRRGILSTLMRRQLDDVAARGEPLAVLLCSESSIYGRYGYGPATYDVQVEIERAHARFTGLDGTPGRLRLVGADEAGKLLPGCYDAVRHRMVGAVTRSEPYWRELLRDPEFDRDGWGRRFDVIHERAPGDVDGFVTYRMKLDAADGLTRTVLEVRELYAADEQVRAALWRYVLDVDLVWTIMARVPLDEPLRWWLADSRRLRQTALSDRLWVRVLDVPAALAGRRYGQDDRLVIEVDDAFRPGDGGTFELRGGPDGAECRRVDGDADLRLGSSELGSVYLGGVRFGVLARAGRVRELTQGAVARADRMFGVDPAPYCSTDF